MGRAHEIRTNIYLHTYVSQKHANFFPYEPRHNALCSSELEAFVLTVEKTPFQFEIFVQLRKRRFFKWPCSGLLRTSRACPLWQTLILSTKTIMLLSANKQALQLRVRFHAVYHSTNPVSQLLL